MTQNLPAPTYPVVVFDYSNVCYEALTAEEKIRVIRTKKAKINQALSDVGQRVEHMALSIQTHCKDSIRRIRAIQKAIEELEEEQRNRIRAQQKQVDDDDLEKAFEEFDRRVFEEQPAVESRKSKRTKTLFRKIAMLAHPDRTDDPDKHTLFSYALLHYENDDWASLEGILKVLTGKASSLFSNMLATLQRESSELKELERHLKEVLSSDDFHMVQLFEASRDIVLFQIEQKNSMVISMMNHRLAALRRALYPQAQTFQAAQSNSFNGWTFMNL